MKILGNIVWLIFGGFGIAVEYFVSSLLLMITIIGIPFGIATMRLGILALWPFGSHIVDKPQDGGCLNMIMNVLWFFVGGFWIAMTHLGFGLLLCITIVGFPWGKMHFRLMRLALAPFGKEIVNNDF
jgi:uncharacterized membrane protein YccF (DUF307 family)